MGKTKVKKSVVSGHLDIVEAGDEYEWKFRPFSGEITGDKRYERGTSDMKSGLFALVIIMCELKEEGADLSSSTRILVQLVKKSAVSGLNEWWNKVI